MRAELMRYRNDSLSFYMNILALTLDCIFFIMIYSNAALTGGAIIGIDILYNIVYLLMTFLIAEKVKTYTKNWCWFGGVLGLVQFARILHVPMHYNGLGELTGFKFAVTIILLALSGACMLAGMVTSYIKAKKLHSYIASLNAEKEGAK